MVAPCQTAGWLVADHIVAKAFVSQIGPDDDDHPIAAWYDGDARHDQEGSGFRNTLVHLRHQANSEKNEPHSQQKKGR